MHWIIMEVKESVLLTTYSWSFHCFGINYKKTFFPHMWDDLDLNTSFKLQNVTYIQKDRLLLKVEEIVYILSNVPHWKLNQIAFLPAVHRSANVLKICILLSPNFTSRNISLGNEQRSVCFRMYFAVFHIEIKSWNFKNMALLK